ncbi:MAG: hypothetical protein HQK55_05610, partial [Deltaproteobacteria bacterium]|nr:hypothetical protein [Deltaproteobacteria bacterium]
CNFSLLLDNQPVYAMKLYRDYNEKKLIFSVIFKVEAFPDNKLALTPLTEEEREHTMDIVQNAIAKMLFETADEANVDWSAGGLRVIVEDPEVKKVFEGLKDLNRQMP